MCGIMGYVGHRECAPLLLAGLERLEYRGYDSAGLAIISDGQTGVLRSVGKLVNLAAALRDEPLSGKTGIGHTRWATHGKPSEQNAHPHSVGPITVVHNGIVENHLALRAKLEARGHVFRSETDTEIFSHLIREGVDAGQSLEMAVRDSLTKVEGSYALAVVSTTEPGRVVVAKNASPMVIGLGEGEMWVASDVPAILPYTRDVIFLLEGEMAVLESDAVSISTLKGTPIRRAPKRINWTPGQAEKGGFKHFMLKEIYEQPRALTDTMRGRISLETGNVFLEDVNIDVALAQHIDHIYIAACGTAWHAALVGRRFVEEATRIRVTVELASEFRYQDPIVNSRTLFIAISQSGETADTLGALREAKARGARTCTVCNVMESSIARQSDDVLYTHAGPEIGVASTKAFMTQLLGLQLLAIHLGRRRGTLEADEARRRLHALTHLPGQIEGILKDTGAVERIAQRYMHARDFLYLGRGVNYPIALEGALKLKEISYIHAEGYAAGEMKHGPIALIDEEMPVVVITPQGRHYQKTASNLQEARARLGRVIAIATEGDAQIAAQCEDVLWVPPVEEALQPFLTTVPLQLLAYHVADLKGTDVDQPRNLAKSVTVE